MNGNRMKTALIRIFLGVTILLLAGYGESPAAIPRVTRMVLNENQMTVLFAEQHTLPFVTFNLLIDAGAWRDPEGKGGLANLAAEAILLGTKDRDFDAINRELDFLGAELSTECGRDFVTVTLRVLKKNLDQGLALFFDVLFNPAFPPEQVERKLREIEAGVRSLQDQPEEVAERNFIQALFRENPYGHPVEGTTESLARIAPEDAARFYRETWQPGNAVLAVVGDLTQEELESAVLSRMRKWPSGKIAEKRFKTIFVESPEPVRVDRPISQATVILGHPGIERSHPDYYAVSVMNQVLGGGGFTSRLMKEIRVKRGLAYATVSFFVPGKFPGSFQILLQTKNSTATEAIRIALDEMRKMKTAPPTDPEIETAKNYLIGSFPMRFDTQAELSEVLVQVEYYGLGLDYFEKYPDYIRAIDRQAVHRAAEKYLMPDRVISSIVADMGKTDLGK